MIKKDLDTKNSLIKTDSFPSFATPRGGYLSLLGIGGNMGDVVRRFDHLLIYLKKSSFLNVIETSPILKNPPFGYIKQDDFYNSLLLVETYLTPHKLLRYVLRVEKVFGRVRTFQDAPRTLDIDIIFYEKVKIKTNVLTLPHHGYQDRPSVLIPLSYMKGKV